MAGRRKKSAKQELEEQILAEGRPRGLGPKWWETTDKESLAVAHRRGRQLLEGGWGNVDWGDD